jgi:hypothetical protein
MKGGTIGGEVRSGESRGGGVRREGGVRGRYKAFSIFHVDNRRNSIQKGRRRTYLSTGHKSQGERWREGRSWWTEK